MLGITGPSIRTTRAIIETLAAARTARDSEEDTSRAIVSTPVIEDGEQICSISHQQKERVRFKQPYPLFAFL